MNVRKEDAAVSIRYQYTLAPHLHTDIKCRLSHLIWIFYEILLRRCASLSYAYSSLEHFSCCGSGIFDNHCRSPYLSTSVYQKRKKLERLKWAHFLIIHQECVIFGAFETEAQCESHSIFHFTVQSICPTSGKMAISLARIVKHQQGIEKFSDVCTANFYFAHSKKKQHCFCASLHWGFENKNYGFFTFLDNRCNSFDAFSSSSLFVSCVELARRFSSENFNRRKSKSDGHSRGFHFVLINTKSIHQINQHQNVTKTTICATQSVQNNAHISLENCRRRMAAMWKTSEVL